MDPSSTENSSSDELEYLPGFGFDPDESEIVQLLKDKESDCTNNEGFRFIQEIKLYECELQELISSSKPSGNKNKYFFTKLKKQHKNKRKTPSGGCWKQTGNSIGNGVKETSFAYKGTQWLMKEYMLLKDELPNESPQWALCKVYKNGE